MYSCPTYFLFDSHEDKNQDITKFSYFSYRALKNTLGEFDATVECNELAIREFIKGEIKY